jgi:hypothetical protein
MANISFSDTIALLFRLIQGLDGIGERIRAIEFDGVSLDGTVSNAQTFTISLCQPIPRNFPHTAYLRPWALRTLIEFCRVSKRERSSASQRPWQSHLKAIPNYFQLS